MDTKKQLIEDINKILEKNKEEIIKTVKFNMPKEENDRNLIVTNFWQLLDNGHIVITIPNIQRNYVQGNYPDIRENFIKDIFQALQEESVINLDIIYGIKEENRFIPIDGQQRLTTLFLLYWYIFVVEKELDKLQYLKIDYGNRQSSREFFELLLDEEFIKSILEETDGMNKQNESNVSTEEINDNYFKEQVDKISISKKIKNNTKFFGAKWNKDTTVKSALNMLDEIEKQYKELNNIKLAQILTNKDTQNRICFKCKYLDNSDEIEPEELYIKMNARGKELSKYAILKSRLEELALKMKKSDEEYFYFCSNIDNKWANNFLKARKKFMKKGNSVDESFKKIETDYYNILRLYITYNFIENMLDFISEKNKKDEFITDFLIDNSEIKFSDKEIYSLNANFFNKLENLMNKLDFLYSNNPRTDCINEKEIFDLEELWNNIIEKDSFKDIYLEDTLYFYALIKFLEKDYSEEYMLKNYSYYTNWIRVIRNYVGGLGHLQIIDKKDEASYFKSVRTIRNLAKELDKYPNIIYCFKDIEASNLELSNDNIWLQTEKIKSQYLLSSNKDWNNAIIEAEKDAYFYGKNYFLFKYIENIKEDHLKLKEFQIYSKITHEIFQNLKRKVQEDENNNFLLQRAMLTKNNYFKNTNNNIKTFLVSNNSDDTNTWRYELNTDKNEIRDKLKCFIDENILEVHLDNLDESELDDIFYRIQEANTEDKLERIILNYLENTNNIGKSWRYYFIKDSKLFYLAQKGNLKFDDNLDESSEYEDSKDRSINVIKTLRKSTHWDYLTLFLKDYLENEIDNNVKNDLMIVYKGKVGDGNDFNHENTLKLIYKNNVYSFLRNKNGDYKIVLEDEKNGNFFDVNFDIKVNKEELDNENKDILINEIFGNTKIKIM